VGETQVWQSADGTSAQVVFRFGETPRPYLWNENDENRNPGETQPRATISPTTTEDGRETRWQPFLPEWLKWLDTYRSAKTREAYGPRVRKVLGRVAKDDLRRITYRDVEGCLSVLEGEDNGWQPNTRNGYVAALRSFWKYLIDKCDLDELGVRDIGRKLDTLPLEVVNREKVQYPPLTKEEFVRILAWAEANRDVEWALSARFKWTSISRIQDVWSLRWSQLDLGPKPSASYKKPSKHGSDLVKLLDQGLARRLRELRDFRQPKPDDSVFAKPGERQRGFDDRFNRRLRICAAHAGVGKYCHAHLIRASARTHATAAGADSRFLDRQGGWSVRAASDGYDRYDPETWREQVRYVALG